MIELTVTNIILLVALAIVIFMWGRYIGQKKGRLIGYINGKHDEREYLFNIMSREAAEDIAKKEAKKLDSLFENIINTLSDDREEKKE